MIQNGVVVSNVHKQTYGEVNEKSNMHVLTG